ncbi:MAG: RBBP9/YdeN family alpha/beta hydrolase [Polymorphobacter sp.]
MSEPDPSLVIIPGFNGSGPDHWQTLWQAKRPRAARVEQAHWHDPDPDSWTATLSATIAAAPGPVILVAHSLGCATVAHWAGRADAGLIDRIAGALLVAPCDVERPGLPVAIARFAPMPRPVLPFRSTVVASSNDAYASLDRARDFAAAWGSAFVDAGPLGHINAASGLGDWPYGEVLLDTLLASANADRSPYRRAAALRAREVVAA